MTCGTMERSVVSCGRWIMIGTNGITRTQPLSLKSGLKHLCKTATNIYKASQCSLVSGRGRVDKDTDSRDLVIKT